MMHMHILLRLMFHHLGSATGISILVYPPLFDLRMLKTLSPTEATLSIPTIKRFITRT